MRTAPSMAETSATTISIGTQVFSVLNSANKHKQSIIIRRSMAAVCGKMLDILRRKKIKGGRAQAIKKQKQKSGTHYGHWAVCVFHQMSWSGRRGKKRCALSCGRHHRGRPIFRSFTTTSFRPATNKHSIERNVCALFKMKQLYKQQGKEEENGEGSLPLLHILARSSVVCRRAARIDE